jgi:putative endonuclease
MPPKHSAVYILASKRNGTLYAGVTSDLRKRVWEHKNEMRAGFIKRYRVCILVYYELYKSMISAIRREKQIKRWSRPWKLHLIEQRNPQWHDL